MEEAMNLTTFEKALLFSFVCIPVRYFVDTSLVSSMSIFSVYLMIVIAISFLARSFFSEKEPTWSRVTNAFYYLIIAALTWYGKESQALTVVHYHLASSLVRHLTVIL